MPSVRTTVQIRSFKQAGGKTASVRNCLIYVYTSSMSVRKCSWKFTVVQGAQKADLKKMLFSTGPLKTRGLAHGLVRPCVNPAPRLIASLPKTVLKLQDGPAKVRPTYHFAGNIILVTFECTGKIQWFLANVITF